MSQHGRSGPVLPSPRQRIACMRALYRCVQLYIRSRGFPQLSGHLRRLSRGPLRGGSASGRVQRRAVGLRAQRLGIKPYSVFRRYPLPIPVYGTAGSGPVGGGPRGRCYGRADPSPNSQGQQAAPGCRVGKAKGLNRSSQIYITMGKGGVQGASKQITLNVTSC